MAKLENTKKVLSLLEWSTGYVRGQCPICKGFGPVVRETLSHVDIGHKKVCLYAKAMKEAGLEVEYVEE